MSSAKKQTKQDLEKKIAELEAKLNKLATQFEAKPADAPKPAPAKPAETKPAEVAKLAETKPAPAKPSEVTKPKGTLPKGFDTKPAETKPAEVAKPAETKPAPAKPAEVTKPKGTLPKGFDTKPAETKPAEAKGQPPSTVQAALENTYQNAKMSDFHWYRAHVTGYSPAPNRYFVRKTAPVGKVPTTNWNDQKAKVTGYTQPSNQYFATRARLAYHPADKTFGGFSGVSLTVDGSVAQTQQAPPPKPSKGTLPKGSTQKEPEPVQISSPDSSSGKSRKEELEEYEKNYLARLDQQRIEEEKEYQKIVEAEVKTRASATRGSLPKGFESKPAPEAPKASRGTLPKGF
jgi:hypothetical protein